MCNHFGCEICGMCHSLDKKEKLLIRIRENESEHVRQETILSHKIISILNKQIQILFIIFAHMSKYPVQTSPYLLTCDFSHTD